MYLTIDALLYLEIYELDPPKFLSAPGLALQTALKKTDIVMLLIVEKGITGGICHSFNRYATANNKYMKNYDRNKKSSYLKHWDVINLYLMFKTIYPFYLKESRLKQSKNLLLISMIKINALFT